MLAKKLMNRNELRRYKRIALDLPARATVNGIDDIVGSLINISPGDLALRTDARVAVGDAVVVYVSGIDVIEGRIARLFPDGFAVSFRLSKTRRVMLTEQIMQKLNPNFASSNKERRGAPRHKQGDQRMVCRLHDGSSLFVRVLDMSVDGLAVESPRKPTVGSAIHVGRMRGIVARHTPRGFVVVYETDASNRPQTKLRVI